jgi:hypothetical protein
MAVEIEADHQSFIWRELVIDTRIQKRLAVVSSHIEMSVRRQHKRRQGTRQKCGAILTRIIARHEKEGLVSDDRPANGAGELVELVRDVDRIIATRLVGATQLVSEGGQKLSVEKRLACQEPPGRSM